MVTQLARNWWALALRGLLAVVFGLLAFLWPGITIAVLVALFGAYALVDGIFTVVAGVRSAGESERWWVLVLEGVVSILAGVIAFFWPGLTALVLVYVIAAWAVLTGLFEIIAAVRLREQIEGEWLLGLSGVASVLLGVALMIMPIAGAVAIIWVIGTYAILFGVLLIALAFRLRNLGGQSRAGAAA
jgi:uncharacterized membrane protein HdeD (DUF308 family)